MALALVTSLVGLIFAGLVLDQWRRRRHAFQLVWGLGLLWYAFAAGIEFVGGTWGWNAGLFRGWYLFGAVLTAGWLGGGTLYLLVRTRFGYFAAASVLLGGLISLALIKEYPGSALNGWITFATSLLFASAVVMATWRSPHSAGHVAFAFLLTGSILAAAAVLGAGVNTAAYIDPRTQAPVAAAMAAEARVVNLPFNVGGGMTLIVGALFSAYVYMPKRRTLRGPLGLAAFVNFFTSLPLAARAHAAGRLSSRVPATILIAIGALVATGATGLERFGQSWLLHAGELVGILLIFAGFLVSEEVFEQAPSVVRRLWPGPASG